MEKICLLIFLGFVRLLKNLSPFPNPPVCRMRRVEVGVGHRTNVRELGQFFDIVRYQQWVELGKWEEFGVWDFFVGWNPEGKVMPTS